MAPSARGERSCCHSDTMDELQNLCSGYINQMTLCILYVVTLWSRPSLSPRKATVCPASVVVVTAVSWVVELKVGAAWSATALAMGFGVCSPPQVYSERELFQVNREVK